MSGSQTSRLGRLTSEKPPALPGDALLQDPESNPGAGVSLPTADLDAIGAWICGGARDD
jgi:hypothetical protein